MRRHPSLPLAATAILVVLVLVVGAVADDAGAPSPAPDPVSPAQGSEPPDELPDVMGAIGDSLTAAVNAGDTFAPAPQHSWAVGDDPDDGVESHRERLIALGADRLRVVDVSRPGARIEDGIDQAVALVTAIDALQPHGSAYVTIVLGANDLCGPLTPADEFEERLRRIVKVLRDGVEDGRPVPGLPSGSRLLMLSVPNVLTLRDVFADDDEVQGFYERFSVCARALHPDASEEDRRRVAAHLDSYNEIIARTCDGVDADTNGAPSLSCRHDLDGDPARSLTGASFGRDEISRIDYFHPSLEGQARIAEESWGHGHWGAPGP